MPLDPATVRKIWDLPTHYDFMHETMDVFMRGFKYTACYHTILHWEFVKGLVACAENNPELFPNFDFFSFRRVRNDLEYIINNYCLWMNYNPQIARYINSEMDVERLVVLLLHVQPHPRRPWWLNQQQLIHSDLAALVEIANAANNNNVIVD